LVRSEGLKRYAWILILAAAACKPLVQAPVKAMKRAIEIEPKVEATVVTIQTSLQPQNRTFSHSIFIANGRARSSDELDHWRLFDFQRNRITYVDDLTKTYYTVPIRRTPQVADDGRLRPVLEATDQKRILHGVEATQFLIRMGGYQRQLWIGYPPAIPPELFAMMHTADDGLPRITGFPLLEHAELPFGKSKMIVDRSVVKIEQRDVPESLLKVRNDYKEVTAPGARRPPVSSPPPDRSTPATGSQSSATVQKTP
jgi:hypothetical protein